MFKQWMQENQLTLETAFLAGYEHALRDLSTFPVTMPGSRSYDLMKDKLQHAKKVAAFQQESK